MNIMEINKRIKQRPPFQMVDRVIEIKPNEYIKGIKNVSANEPYLVGHFPEFPIMPGVMVIESAAQLCAIMLSECKNENLDSTYGLLLKVTEFKLIKPILPGDSMIIEANTKALTSSLAKFKVKVSVRDNVYATGELVFTFATEDKILEANNDI